MPIPEKQLETWAHQGAISTAKSTHESVRNALFESKSLRQMDLDVYLQGSYKNSTNIRGDSDVDIIVQLNSVFIPDTSGLSSSEREQFVMTYGDAAYSWDNFRTDVLKALREYYGSKAITESNKSIKVAGVSGRLPSDVVVCLQYRKYRRFRGIGDEDYIEGIIFYTLVERRKVINYPKKHYVNGVNKQKRTDNFYKRTVRMFKNARTYLVDNGTVDAKLAPSYFLECLLYNVPDRFFTTSYQETFYQVLKWLCQTNLSGFTCQNEQLPLFGSSPEQWSETRAQKLIESLVKLWNQW
ncbi:nucleotidyltransferase [Moorella thermoacetica]|uniref:cGAS/DncV-like nucleotidyltransferase C-terminal helical domain-containing protein n=1 Tax=Moorella thermoacetica (strain ATCC 39073 / JCM 9320) TaxID=264732 RepID=Q2RKS6_MOOTA|nr:nucleotidyltransferase [Moorella thermoacetica]AKX96031.1 hypothetical protein MOTHA_c06740 [Moorella thermoacetica]OIQ56117.1 hypothetical protein MOCA_18200 [Moorella thermoacetica]QCZ99841.1 hypothetical protein MothHH_00688 [Moorella thermoacetica]TYL08299.1 hypothetical protein MOLA_20270 [Moorella thermoacetica]TYL08609.1 hypothetical protein MOOCA_18370 [Moorella thermoacetica]